MSARTKKILTVIAAMLLFSVAFSLILVGGDSIVISEFTHKTDKIPSSFNGFRILQISDFHGRDLGSNQQSLIKLIRKCDPDIIVITGDLIDRNNYDEKSGMELVRGVLKIAPVYYVTGNHEWQSDKYPDSLKPKLEQAGVVVLSDANYRIKKGNDEIAIAGIDDVSRTGWGETKAISVKSDLDMAIRGIPDGDFKVLLAHRPEMMQVYAQSGVDLVLAGHTHGGQIQFPFMGAMFAPDQGFFPNYVSGEYGLGNSTLIVSKGIGNSIVPLRMLCNPEIVLVTLEK